MSRVDDEVVLEIPLDMSLAELKNVLPAAGTPTLAAAEVIEAGASTRIKSSNANPTAFYDWLNLISALQVFRASTSLNICNFGNTDDAISVKPHAVSNGDSYCEELNFARLFLGDNTAAVIDIHLTNASTQPLALISSDLVVCNTTSRLHLCDCATVSEVRGVEAPAPYLAKWVYSPDCGQTLLNLECYLSGPGGITMTFSKSGPEADNWNIVDAPPMNNGAWAITFIYMTNA